MSRRQTAALDVVGAGVILFGLVSLATGLAMALTPEAFFERVGPYGVRNDHYLGDLASYALALGVALLVAARWHAWRVPVLAVATLQGFLHAINHVIDVGEARPAWLGPANLAALVVAALLLGLLLAAARREREARR